jgi:UDP-MurNAc hydroxylase
MEIMYLGHAGFCVETADAILVMDPWLSSHGAFDAAWFQFPQNHHLAPLLRQRLAASRKPRFIYISHEHHDHFDPDFLAGLPKDVTYLIADFQRPAVKDALVSLGASRVIACAHGQAVAIPGGCVKLYLDDSGLNRDSGILFRSADTAFLNLNDCKLYDELPEIVRSEGPISVFTCQFSGATWHPTCYDYSRDEYERISRHKMMSKFEMVARAIDITKPQVYLPSAGPACFLDPALLHLNFERVNIFPRVPKLFQYFEKRLADSPTRLMDISPGDILHTPDNRMVRNGGTALDENDFESYIKSYTAQYTAFFSAQQSRGLQHDAESVLAQLKIELERKLSEFTLHTRVQVPLYFGLLDHARALVRVGFAERAVEIVPAVRELDYYSIVAPAWQVSRILDRSITWEQFALTFRMRLNRKPDIYQTLIQGFLLMEPEDLNWFCAKLLEIEEKQKRSVIEAGGTRYSIDRYCPHQGADLSQGWLDQGRLWTCPRHRWQFALDKDGRCLTSDASIHAICLENE